MPSPKISPSFNITKNDGVVLSVSHPAIPNVGWEQWYLLISDVHWDNPNCERDLLKRDLDLAVKRGAGIFSFGDWFCAMQGKADPRNTKDNVREEHRGGNYFDLLVDTAAEWLAPYANNIVMMSEGNHEWNIRRRWETDLHRRLTQSLGVQMMRTWGFVRFHFDSKKLNGGRSRQIMYFHHGYGGGGPVTKGVIQHQRDSAMVADADILVSGHIHEQTLVSAPVLGVNHNGQYYVRNRINLRCSTYKNEFKVDEWHAQQGRGPKPLGGWWIRFFVDKSAPSKIGREEIRT